MPEVVVHAATASTAAILLISAASSAAAAAWLLTRRQTASAVGQLQVALANEQKKRAADRAGRIRAEQRLKELNLQLAQLRATAGTTGSNGVDSSSHSSTSGMQTATCGAGRREPAVYPFTPIGVLRSCFSVRNGTPRQPHLVPSARAELKLAIDVPAACLKGLQGFSHCWVLYVFHQNTDLGNLMAARAAEAAPGSGSGQGRESSSSSSNYCSQIKSQIRVPRLNGGKMGVLATRSPHRPVPIGLSTAKIVSVDEKAGVLVLGGVDVVDGSPVLDIKPYVPFSDALPDASAPDWVRAAADEEPLALVGGVSISTAAQSALEKAWRAVRHTSMYSSAQELTGLVQEVLSRDIRSLHQRTDIAPVAVQQQPSAAATGDATASTVDPAQQAVDSVEYRVVLDGVLVTYSIDRQSSSVTVLDACVAQLESGCLVLPQGNDTTSV